MYQDELNREAKLFVRGLEYILEDFSKFVRKFIISLGLTDGH